MIAYQTDDTGRFVGTVECQLSPLEPGKYLVPRGAVVVAPPFLAEDQFAVWNGSDWSVQIVKPIFTETEPVVAPWDEIRDRRNYLLAASDWTQVADAPVDAVAWAVYRQQLRDLPQNFSNPDDVVWPIRPQ